MGRYLHVAELLLRLFPKTWQARFRSQTLETLEDALHGIEVRQQREVFWQFVLSIPRSFLVTWLQWKPGRAEPISRKEAFWWWVGGTGVVLALVCGWLVYPGLSEAMPVPYLLLFLFGQAVLAWALYRFTQSALRVVRLVAAVVTSVALFGLSLWLTGGIGFIILLEAHVYLSMISVGTFCLAVLLPSLTLAALLIRGDRMRGIGLDAQKEKRVIRDIWIVRNGALALVGIFLAQACLGYLLAAKPIPSGELEGARRLAPEQHPSSNAYRWLVTKDLPDIQILTSLEDCAEVRVLINELEKFAEIRVVDLSGKWSEKSELPEIRQLQAVKKCLEHELHVAGKEGDFELQETVARKLVRVAVAIGELPTIITYLNYSSSIDLILEDAVKNPSLLNTLPSRKVYADIVARAYRGESAGSAYLSRIYRADSSFSERVLFQMIPFAWEPNRLDRGYAAAMEVMADIETRCTESEESWQVRVSDARRAYLGPLGVNFVPYLANYSQFLLEKSRSCDTYQKLQ